VSAAVARWTARGIEVGYLLLTRGEAGMPNPPEETARLRVAEQQTACALVGVKHLTVLEHPDGVCATRATGGFSRSRSTTRISNRTPFTEAMQD
jgi:LmbE family N-acetylglucosaminyl deacetylase